MQKNIYIFVATSLLGMTLGASAGKKLPSIKHPILADLKLLQAVGLSAQAYDAKSGVAYALISESEQIALTKKAHEWKRCGGFEALPSIPQNPQALLKGLSFEVVKAQKQKETLKFKSLVRNPAIDTALAQLDVSKLVDFVTWYSSYPSRFANGQAPNTAPEALKLKIESLVTEAAKTRNEVSSYAKVEMISHQSTQQKSIRLHITGKSRPNEIVVLGGHLDSISWNGKAPGADDNASGSANIFEAARVILSQPQPERSVEFFWYAGEELGLLGSAEIAKDYKNQNKDVISALQLDMTLFAGTGEGVIASMTDFTSPWLRQLIVELNQLYAGGKIIDGECGYGCSDHASWFKNGYPTVMPFEASFDDMNHSIHTNGDTITNSSNFKHSLVFAKLATAYALEMSNSTERAP